MDSMNAKGNGGEYIGTADYDVRRTAQEKLAELVGLRLPQTFVPKREALWDIGEQAKRALEHKIDELPFFRDLAPLYRDRIRKEDARDYESTPVQRIRMVPTHEDRRPVTEKAAGTLIARGVAALEVVN